MGISSMLWLKEAQFDEIISLDEQRTYNKEL